MRDTQESCARVNLLRSQKLPVRILAAILITGGLVITVGMTRLGPVGAQSSLPAITIRAPTTSFFFPQRAPAANEGATLSWTVTRTGSTSDELTVPLLWYRRGWRARIGTWVARGHYDSFFEFTQSNPKVEAVTFPVGASEVTVSVDTTDDELWERNAVLLVCVSDIRSDGEGVTYQAPDWGDCAGWRLTNDDAPPLVAITPDQTTANEGARAAFTLTRAADDASQAEQVVVSHSRVDARGNVSAYSLNEPVSFAPGELTKKHYVSLSNNSVRSDPDFFTLRVEIADPVSEPDAPIGNYRANATTRRADVAVVDDDLPLVSVSARTSQTEETPVEFTVTRVDAISMPLTIDTSLTQTGNYLPSTVPTTFTFESNVATKTLSLPVDDGVDEPDGSVILTLSSTGEYKIAVGSEITTVVVTDDDEPQIVTLERDTESVEEGGDATFTLTRYAKTENSLALTGQAIEWPSVVNVVVTQQGEFIDGTLPTSVTFAPHSSTATLTVPTVDDARPLPLEESYESAVRFHPAYEDDGSITATLAPGANYIAGLPLDERTDPADDMTSGTIVLKDNEPPLVRATLIPNSPDDRPTTETTITEGESATIYVKRYFYDTSQDLTVRFTNREIRCFDPAQSDGTQRGLIFREIPLAQEFGPSRVYSVTIPAGQDRSTTVIPTSTDNAHECSMRWDVEMLSPAVPEGSTPALWQERYNEWSYHPLRPDNATITMNDDDDLPVITFTSQTVAEDVGTAEIVATLRTEAITEGYAASWPITLHWWTVPQTASETADFTKIESQSVTIPANRSGGTSEHRLRIPIVDDLVPEGSETVAIGYRFSTSFTQNLDLNLSGASPTVTITDDDPLPIISVPSSVAAEETVGSVSIAFALDRASELPVAVHWTTEDESARTGSPPLDSDYVPASGTYTFAPGTVTGEVAIEILDDIYDEDAESFHVRLSSPVNGTIGTQSVTITIADDDEEPNVVLINPFGVGIPESIGIAEFRVELRNARSVATVSGKDIVITYSAADGGRTPAQRAANFDSDYAMPNTSLTIPAGSESGAISVNIVDDQNDEWHEFFTVSLDSVTNASEASAETSRIYAAIRDDDPLPVVAIENASGREPANAADTLTIEIPVVLDRASGKTVHVSYKTADGTAQSLAATTGAHDDDYESTAGRLTFAPGEIKKNILVTVKGDDYAELDEQFTVSISSSFEATWEDGTGVGTIQDSSRLPLILLEAVSPDRSVAEDVGEVRFLLSLNHPDDIGHIISGRATTIDYQIVAYTPPPNRNVREAIRGTDYLLPANGTIVFAPGNRAATLEIPIVDDELDEPIERFTIRFNNAVNATYTDVAETTIAIRDDDAAPRIDVLDARVREDLGPMRFDVILASVSSRDVSFDYNTQMGTAFEEEDYTFALGEVTIPAGDTTATIEVEVINDGERETIEERFTLFVRNAVNGILVNTEPVGYIIDDDQSLAPGQQGAILVSSTQIEVDEGDAAGTSMTVSLSSEPTGTVVVLVNGAGGTVLAYSPTSLTFNDVTWNDPQTLTFTASEDDDADDEYFPLFLVADGGGYTRSLRGVLVTVDDDDTAGIVVSPSSLAVDENDSASISVVLASQPSSEVKVDIAKDDAAASDLASIQLGTGTLTFTASNWQTAQTVSVAAVDDDDASDETINLVLQGSGTGYAGVTKSIMVTTNDDDTIGLVLRNSAGAKLGDAPALTLRERESVYVTAELATQPTDEVTVGISVTRFTELAVDTDGTPGTRSLTFDAQDWNVPKSLKLISIGDDNSLDSTPVPVTFSADGGGYQGLVVPALNVAISDADSAVLMISTDSLVVFEDDADGTSYSIMLAAQPVGVPGGAESVTVAVTAGVGSGLTVRPTQLTFTGSDWNVAQTIVVTAAGDEDAEDQTAILVHSAAGAAEYAGVSSDVAVSIRDDDEPALVITPSSLSVNEGEMASYSVRLATKPTGDVGVVVSGHSGSDFSLDSSRLSFTNSNWNTPQSVQVSAASDDDGQPDVVTLIHTANGSDHGGVTARVTVNTIEDEQEALVVNTTRISLAEGGDATFSVALASRPSTAVTVNLSAPQNSDLVLDKTSLTFSASDWRTAQTVTVTSSQDDDATDENVEVRVEVGPGAYGAAAVVLQVAVIDDDSVDIVLSGDKLYVVEGFRTTYSVRLATQPSETATVDINVPAGADIFVLPRQLSFNADSWMTEQTVTIVTRLDLDADADPPITVTHTARNGDYDTATKTLTVVVLEADVRGLVFVDSDDDTVDASGSLDIDEGGSTSYGVRLASQPSAQVVVTLSPGGVGLSADRTSLTFTSSDWFSAQTVTAAASHDDDTSDGAANIVHTVAEGVYGPVRRSIEFVIADDDTAAIVLTDSNGTALTTDGLTVTEGATASYRVQLATEPGATVTVAISGTANTDLTTDEPSLTFTSMNWNTPRTVEVSAGHDDDAVADAEVTLSHGASGGEYGSVMADLAVVIAEDDSDGFIVTDSAGDPLPGDILVVNEGGSAAYKISLSTEPTGPVTVALTGTANTDLQLDKTEITFIATNWSTPQTVTTTAAHDDDAVNEPVAVVHTPSGAGYAAPAFSLNAVIDDDDHQSVMVSVESLDIPEGGTTSVSVSLGTKPIGDVVVDLILSPGADLGLPIAQLTFTAQNWMTAQNVSVVSQHDDDASDDAAQIGFNANGGDYNNVLAILPAIIRDDDEPGIVLNEDSLEVMEGSTADFTVRLATQPSQTVTVTIGGSAGTSLTLSSARLVFTSTDWSTPQTVTATAAHDDDIDAETIEVSLAARDGDYDSATASLTVTVVDDDLPDVEVSFGSGSYMVSEGSTVSVSVSLSAVPGREVVVPITAVGLGGADATDFSGVPSSVTFAADETSKQFVFAATDDSVDDDGESVRLSFGVLPAGVTAVSPVSATVAIVDDDLPDVEVSFGSGSYMVSEGSTVSVSVSLSAVPGREVVVPITAVGLGGADATDFSGVPSSVTFAADETSKQFVFAATDDSVDDDGESVRLSFGVLPAGVTAVSPVSATVAIVDDDLPDVEVSFGSGSYMVSEGSTVSVSVSLSAVPGREVVVPITAVGLGGADATDFSGVPSSVTFAADETSKQFVFAATDDSVDDDGESVRLSFGVLPAGVTAVSPVSATVAIVDDDLPDVEVSFGSGSYMVSEGSTVSVSVSLSAVPGREVVVPITAVGLGGADATDFSGVPSSVTFAADETSKQFVFAATDDSVDDDGESVRLSFGVLPAGVTAVSPVSATVAIVDDDLPDVEVSFGSGSYMVSEGSTVSVSVSLSAVPGREVVVPITAVGLGGADATDFSGVPSSVTFAADETSKQFVFAATDDSVDDDGESVRLSFGVLPAGVTAVSPVSATVAIVDDDLPDVEVSFGSGSYMVSEGSTVSVSVSLSAVPESRGGGADHGGGAGRRRRDGFLGGAVERDVRG